MSDIIGTDGKPLETIEKRMETLEKEVANVKDALSLYGSFLMHLKRFMDVLPVKNFKKEEAKK